MVVDQQNTTLHQSETPFLQEHFFSPSPLPLSHFLSSPQFSHGQKAKNASKRLENLTETLVIQATPWGDITPIHSP